ncbi:MAG: ATP-binding protein [Actinomycetaceae bacterium]|nr:ATP-binding protein [Actinomycetaceae bacterium]
MKLIERNRYIETLKAVKDIPDIKVITGIRRSGKSKLMDAFSALVEKDTNANVVRINLNQKKHSSLLDAEKLYDYIEKHHRQNAQNYLFIDEVQLCQGFEQVVNSVHDEEIYDIYLTGSNAFLLSSDLATLFGGRVFEINMFPFSFSEYLTYFPNSDIDKAFDDYYTKGGMSGSYPYRNENDAKKYIQGVYKATVVKDIVQKYSIENEDLLIMIANFLMDNIGNTTSLRNIATKLTSDSYKTNDKTVGAYVNYLCRSFMFYPMQAYDIKGKRYLESNKKYYLADLSFRFSELGTKFADSGHLYENLVALELLRRGYEVYTGRLYSKEIDFVAKKDGKLHYIQVSDDITRPKTFNREITPLLSIKEAYPKSIIARTKHDDMQQDGVAIIDIARWLANDTNFGNIYF